MKIKAMTTECRPRLVTLEPYGDITATQYKGLWSGDVVDINDGVAWRLIDIGCCVAVDDATTEDDGGDE